MRVQHDDATQIGNEYKRALWTKWVCYSAKFWRWSTYNEKLKMQ